MTIKEAIKKSGLSQKAVGEMAFPDIGGKAAEKRIGKMVNNINLCKIEDVSSVLDVLGMGLVAVGEEGEIEIKFE